MTNGIDTWDRQKSRNRQHGLMLVVSCVLSVVAILFAVDFSTFSNNTLLHDSRDNATHQINGTSGIPPRQQTAVTSHTIRAILTEVSWVKNQSAYPFAGKNAMPGVMAGLGLQKISPAQLAFTTKTIAHLRTNHTSARAPPHAI